MALGQVPCLLKGMKIKMGDGNYKLVEELIEGEEIMDLLGRKIKILKSDRKTPEELFGFINN